MGSFLLPSVDQLSGDAGFTFQQDLSTAHSAKGTLTVLRTWCPVFDCSDLKENGCTIVERSERHQPHNAGELKATIRATSTSRRP